MYLYLVVGMWSFLGYGFYEVLNKRIEPPDISPSKDMDRFWQESPLNWRKPRRMVFRRIWNQKRKRVQYILHTQESFYFMLHSLFLESLFILFKAFFVKRRMSKSTLHMYKLFHNEIYFLSRLNKSLFKKRGLSR